MFESIRKHSKIVMIFLFLLIIPSFVPVSYTHLTLPTTPYV